MRPIFIALLFMTAFISPISAKDVVFFQKETDKFWAVFGEAETETGQVTCYGRANKKDGSFIQIHRSLVDGEVWAIIRNTAWEIKLKAGECFVGISFEAGRTRSLMERNSPTRSGTRTPS